MSLFRVEVVMPRSQKAFTLVELLVVIGIIAVLISILLPALSKVRWQATVTSCAARLRDLSNAVIMYANDNRGALPPYPGDNGQASFTISPAPGSAASINAAYQIWESTSNIGVGWNLGRLLVTKHITTPKVLACPQIKEGDPANSWRHFSNYVMNPHIAYRNGGTSIATFWWKRLPGYGKVPKDELQHVNGFGTIITMKPLEFRRAMIIEPMFALYTSSDLRYVTHLYGSRRAYNMAYPDGSVATYVASHYTQRVIDRWVRFLDLSNAVQYAASGGSVDWANGASWTNQKFNAIPILPN